MRETKYCPKCKRDLKRKEFASMDANCPCKDCQRGISGYAGETTVSEVRSVSVPGQTVLRTPREKPTID